MIYTNTKFALTLIIGVLVLSFSKPKDQFHDDYIEFFDALENFREVVKSYGDTASALSVLETEAADLQHHTSRMEMEAASSWDSFEDASWPAPPRNWRCKLQCAYEWWKCKSGGEGDTFMCLAAYNNCKQNC